MDVQNYYEKPGFVNFQDKIPMLLRVWNLLADIELNKTKKIVLFYDSSLMEFLDREQNQS